MDAQAQPCVLDVVRPGDRPDLAVIGDRRRPATVRPGRGRRRSWAGTRRSRWRRSRHTGGRTSRGGAGCGRGPPGPARRSSRSCRPARARRSPRDRQRSARWRRPDRCGRCERPQTGSRRVPERAREPKRVKRLANRLRRLMERETVVKPADHRTNACLDRGRVTKGGSRLHEARPREHRSIERCANPIWCPTVPRHCPKLAQAQCLTQMASGSTPVSTHIPPSNRRLHRSHINGDSG